MLAADSQQMPGRASASAALISFVISPGFAAAQVKVLVDDDPVERAGDGMRALRHLGVGPVAGQGEHRDAVPVPALVR